MKYKASQELIIASYADGGIVASVVYPNSDSGERYLYMLVFENEDCARGFVEENVNGPVFFTKKKMGVLAKEFNCSLLYPGLTGIAYVNANGDVEHLDTDDFIKKAYSHLKSSRKVDGGPLVVDGKVESAENINFNSKYHVMFNSRNELVVKRVYDKNNKRKDWLIVTTTKELLQSQADALKIGKKNRTIAYNTLSSILLCFLPGKMMSSFDGIMYIDESGTTMVSKKKIRKIMDDRELILDRVCVENPIYLDEHYFVAADKVYGTPTLSIDGGEFIVASQNMDVMLTAFRQENIKTDSMLFTNCMTLRDILDGCIAEGCDGVAICMDENPDHMIHFTIDELCDIALDGTGDENPDDLAYIYSDDAYMMSDKLIMVADAGYVVAQMKDDETGEVVNVILVGEDEEIMRISLEETGYRYDDDRVIERHMYEIFAEFRDEGQLHDCDGIMYFDYDGYYVIPKDDILGSLEEWEATSHKVPVKVDLDFDVYHCIVLNGYRPVTLIGPDDTPFVLVARESEDLERAVANMIDDDEHLTYDNSRTLKQIVESAIFGDMGIAMCHGNGVTFVEPRRLSQALYGDDEF